MRRISNYRDLPLWSRWLRPFWYCSRVLSSSCRDTESIHSSKTEDASPNTEATWRKQEMCRHRNSKIQSCSLKWGQNYRKSLWRFMSILYLLERLKRKELFKSGQKQPHQGAKWFIICGAKLFWENILKRVLNEVFTNTWKVQWLTLTNNHSYKTSDKDFRCERK